MKGVGWLIDWHGGGFLTLPVAPFVTKRRKILTTCCRHASLHENFGFSFCAELDDHLRKGFNSIIILGAWTLWNLRNRCVFYGEPPNLARALLLASEELLFGGFAGARGINHLLAQGLIVY